MATASIAPSVKAPISVEEYLRTVYRPDCDYEKGSVEERNVGEYEHGKVQSKLDRLLGNRESEWGIDVIVECRLQVAEDSFRVLDVMVLRRGTKVSRIVREVPLICIEVLSPEDTWVRMRARLNDYLAMGVEHVWCFDPNVREARTYTAEGFQLVRTPELAIPDTSIRINIAEVFAILDEQ